MTVMVGLWQKKIDYNNSSEFVYSGRASGYLQKSTSTLMLSVKLILILSVKDVMSVFLSHWIPLIMVPAYYTSIFETQHFFNDNIAVYGIGVIPYQINNKKSCASLNFCFKICTHWVHRETKQDQNLVYSNHSPLRYDQPIFEAIVI